MTSPFLTEPDDIFGTPNPLVDNLPSTDTADPRNHHTAAVGIAAAFLAWRTLNAQKLVDDYVSRKSIEHIVLENVFTMLAKPAYEDLFTDLKVPEAEGMAVLHAQELEAYLGATSLEAVEKGYQAEIARGVAPELAWERAATAFGLDDRQMQSWIMAQRMNKTDYADAAVSPAAEAALDKGLLQRADILGQTEAWQARQTGQTLLWMHLEETGNLPAGCLKRWWTKEDELVCPVCGPLHKQMVPVAERFEVPGGSVWAPGMHPNCRCSLELVYPNKAEGLLEKRIIENVKDVAVGPTPNTQQIRASVVKPKRFLVKLKSQQNTSPTPNILKALGTDIYNRDTHGHFSRTEERQAEAEVETEVANPLLAPPVTQANPLLETNPLVRASTANPLAQAKAETAPNPLATANPLEVANPLLVGNPLLARAKAPININIKWKPAGPPPDPDRMPVLPADDYFRAVMAGEAGRGAAGDWASGELGGGPSKPPVTWHGHHDNLDDPYSQQFEPGDYALNMGSVIDFSLAPDESVLGYTFSGSAASHDINGVLRDQGWMYEPLWRNGDDDYEAQEYNYLDPGRAPEMPYKSNEDGEILERARDIEGDSAQWVDMLDSEEMHKMIIETHGDLYYDLDPHAMKDLIADEASDITSDLGQKLLQWTLDNYPPSSMEDQIDMEGPGYYRSPKVFTFPQGHLGDWESGRHGAVHPRIGGKYRIAAIKYHSLVGEDGHSLEGELFAHRVKGWEEYQLVPIDET